MQNIVSERSPFSRFTGLTMLELIIALSIITLTAGITLSGLINYQEAHQVGVADSIQSISGFDRR